MSFSYNEALVLESNPIIENLLIHIDKDRMIENIKEVVLETVTLSGLKEEFQPSIKGVQLSNKINGEHIKSYFVIVLNGIEKVWRKLVVEHESLQSYQSEPLYENVFTYFDLLVDEMNFDTLFQQDLAWINQE